MAFGLYVYFWTFWKMKVCPMLGFFVFFFKEYLVPPCCENLLVQWHCWAWEPLQDSGADGSPRAGSEQSSSVPSETAKTCVLVSWVRTGYLLRENEVRRFIHQLWLHRHFEGHSLIQTIKLCFHKISLQKKKRVWIFKDLFSWTS
jgi:hypothetical protein